ncbi:MAG: folylpolyglutamate synthase/dihydrofolate synthase family protein [Myxococcota bacterium]
MGRLSPEAALAHLAGRSPSSIKMGLERVQRALERLGHPERRVPALHVAGTNGKGSTCAIAAACLSTTYRVGLYTSPHLVRVNERFRVGDRDIDDRTLGTRIADVVEVLGEEHELTYFELGTLVAFHHFAEERVDLAVLETGLGGRLDATTSCAPRVTCVTPVSFDHQEYLGHTLAAIAREKAGIIKRGVPVISSRQEPEAMEVIQRIAEQQGAELCVEGRDFSAEKAADGLRFRGRWLAVSGLALPLAGAHQTQNAATALACLEALGQAGFPLTTEALARGLSATRWPGRLERIEGTPPVVLDGAHNPAGVEVLVAALDELAQGRPVHLVFGVLADKDSTPMMERLFPRCASVALTPLPSPRSKDPSTYEAWARSLGPLISLHSSPRQALEAAQRRASPDGLVLVAGSLVLVGEIRRLFEPLR